MPTQNPRITITLTPEVHAVLTELSRETGQSLSSIVGELCGMSVPVFQRVVEAVRAAKEIQSAAGTEIAAGLERAQAKLEGQMQLVMGDMDEAFRPILVEAEKVKRRAGRAGGTPRSGGGDRRPAGGVNPRPCNTGVRCTSGGVEGGEAWRPLTGTKRRSAPMRIRCWRP